MADPIEWYPARILQARAEGDDGPSTPGSPNSFALIILNQPLRDVQTLKKLWGNCKQDRPLPLDPSMPALNPLLMHCQHPCESQQTAAPTVSWMSVKMTTRANFL